MPSAIVKSWNPGHASIDLDGFGTITFDIGDLDAAKPRAWDSFGKGARISYELRDGPRGRPKLTKVRLVAPPPPLASVWAF
jgi:hypothetical protein